MMVMMMMMMVRIVMTVSEASDIYGSCSLAALLATPRYPQVLKCTRSLQLHNTQGLRFSGIDMLVMPKCSTVQLSDRKWQI